MKFSPLRWGSGTMADCALWHCQTSPVEQLFWGATRGVARGHSATPAISHLGLLMINTQMHQSYSKFKFWLGFVMFCYFMFGVCSLCGIWPLRSGFQERLTRQSGNAHGEKTLPADANGLYSIRAGTVAHAHR